MSNASPSKCFVTTLDLKHADKLRKDLESQGFDFTQPPYTIFAAKKKNISCTLFSSGKLMVQGKEMNEFIEFYLEPEILGNMSFTHRDALLNKSERIGVDEAGKGDFFGPLCIAGVYAKDDMVLDLVKLGIKDSKTLSDATVLKLAKAVIAEFPHSIVRIMPKRYNELYGQFKNLNALLAWGHATVIENLAKKTGCNTAIIDQFAAKYVVETALKRKQLQINLTQQHRAESDPVVAAASILARAAFLDGLENLGKTFGMTLPKGASSLTIEAGKQLISLHGKQALEEACKLHFKTYSTVTGEEKESSVLIDDMELPS